MSSLSTRTNSCIRSQHTAQMVHLSVCVLLTQQLLPSVATLYSTMELANLTYHTTATPSRTLFTW